MNSAAAARSNPVSWPQLGVAILASAATGLLVAVVSGLSDPLEALYPVLLVAFATAGGLVIRSAVRRGEAFGVLPMVTGFYLLTFVVGSAYYYAPNRVAGGSVIYGLLGRYSTDGLILAVLAGFLGWIAFATGFWAANFARSARRLPRPALRTAGSSLAVVVSLLVFGWAARALAFEQGLYFHYSGTPEADGTGIFSVLISSLAKLPVVATALAGVARLKGNRSAGRWFFPLLIVEFAWAIPTGERAQVISLAIMAAVVRYYGTRRAFPWPLVAAIVALAVLIVFPFITLYRGEGGSSGYQRNARAQLSAAYRGIAGETPFEVLRGGVQDVSSRFSGAASLGAMMTQGRDQYPRTAQETVSDWVGAFVPRFILPSKTDPGSIGNEYGKAYGIVAPRSETGASIAITNPGDFYGSFGWAGLVLGLFAAGAAYRAIDEYFSDKRDNELMLAIFAAVIGPIALFVETSFAIGFFASLKDLVVDVAVIGLVTILINYARTEARPAGSG